MSRTQAALCFIGGTGRSGTTILRKMFAQHPDVATHSTETRFLVDPDGIVDFYDSMMAGWSPFHYDVKLRRLNRLLRQLGRTPPLASLAISLTTRCLRQGSQAMDGSRLTALSGGGVRSTLAKRPMISRLIPRYATVDLSSLDPHFARHVSELFDDLVQFSFAGRWTGAPMGQESTIHVGHLWEIEELVQVLSSFCRNVFGSASQRQDASHFVEDSPLNILSFDRILKILPESRLVHVYRDPRDVVSSLMGMSWSPTEPLQAAHSYVTIMNQWERVRSRIPADTYIELPLETLVAEPSASLRNVCKHWGLGCESTLLDVDLDHAHIGRWREDIEGRYKAELEMMLAPFIAKYGVTQ